jgi:hypothetical protein
MLTSRTSSIAKLVAIFIALTTVFPGESYAGFGVYQPSRYYASPFGEVRWFQAAPGLLLLSDLKQGVAAIDLKTGGVKWSHSASGGRLDRVWKVGEHLILSGVDMEVLDRNTGDVVWSDLLACPTGGICGSRILHVDNKSVFFSGSGEVHNRLWRLDLEQGRALWKKSATVRHPKRMWGGESRLVIEEAIPPFAIRWLESDSGKTLKTWSWPQTKGPRPSERVHVTKDGTVLAIQLKTGDGSLAKVARLTEKTTKITSIDGGDSLPTRAVWAYANKHSFFGLVPDPRGEGGSFVRKRLTAPTLEVTKAPIMDTPRIVGSQALVHTHSGTDSIITGYDLTSTQKTFTSKIATPARRAHIIPANGLAIVMLAGAPRPFMVVAPDQRKLLGVGNIVQENVNTFTAMNIGATLYIAEGRGIQGYALRTMDYVTSKLERQLNEAEVEDALLTWSSISLLAGTAPEVTSWLPKIMAQRFLVLRHAFDAGETKQVLNELVDELALKELQDALYLRPRLRPLASLIADKLLKRADLVKPAELGDLLVMSRHVQGLIRRHVNADIDEEMREDFGSAVLGLAAVLMGADASRAAADLLVVWSQVNEDPPPGFGSLYRRAALNALSELFQSTRYDLESTEDQIRRPAAHLLNAFPHTTQALDRNLGPLISKVLSKDHNRARAAGARLVDALNIALKSARKTMGKGLTTPGCSAVCEAIGATCLNRCRDPRSCTKATVKCVKQCRKKNLVRWDAPSGFPRANDQLRICD